MMLFKDESSKPSGQSFSKQTSPNTAPNSQQARLAKYTQSQSAIHGRVGFAEVAEAPPDHLRSGCDVHLGSVESRNYKPQALHWSFRKGDALAALPSSSSLMTLRKLQSGADGGASASTTAQVSPSIIVIIIVLTIIFFLSAFLHLVIRWLARNPALIRRGLRAGGANGAPPNNRIIALTAIHGQLQQLFSMQDAGLDRSLIDELPVFTYKAAMAGLKEGADCAICLCEFVVDDELRLLPSCGHAFHTDCIDTWFLSHSTCPLCRTLLLPECWLPGSLQPLLSSEVSVVSDVEHSHLAVDATTAPVSHRSVSLGSSSRRSSLGRLSLVGGITLGSMHPDHIQSREQLSAEQQHLLCQNGSTMPTSCASIDGSSVIRILTNSARLSNFSLDKSQNSTELGKFDAFSEAENGTPQATKLGSDEVTSSVLSNVTTGAFATAVSDSGRLSYTSLGNNTDAQSGRYSEQLERASPYGSGRRISVQLGKCRVANEQKGWASKFKAHGESFSRGSYEYVIDSSASLEVLIPPNSRANTLISSSRFNDLLNLSRRVRRSLAADNALPAPGSDNAMQDMNGRSSSPKMQWASNSFRKLKQCHGENAVANTGDATNASLDSSRPRDYFDGSERWPADLTKVGDIEELSTATTTWENTKLDSSFSFDCASQKHSELDFLCKFEAGEGSPILGSSKRAVSFRLPTPASHHVLSAKLRASASRRALSESGEALWYWEPSLMSEDRIELGDERDDQMLILDKKTSLHQSSRFGKKTMDWLVGWPRRMVHPDKSLANEG